MLLSIQVIWTRPATNWRQLVTTGNLLTVEDVAEWLRVKPETVRTWLRSNQITGYNLGGRTGWRVPAGEIDRLLEERTNRRNSATGSAERR
jgi:excisionase family DNA binding protein